MLTMREAAMVEGRRSCKHLGKVEADVEAAYETAALFEKHGTVVLLTSSMERMGLYRLIRSLVLDE